MRERLILITCTVIPFFASITVMQEPADCSGIYWEILDRADSLAAQNDPDSAMLFVEEAKLVAQTLYGPSDTTVRAKTFKDGVWRFCYFTSYAEAESLYTRVHSIEKGALGEDDPCLVETFMNLAWVYGQRDRDDEAGDLYEQAVGLAEREYGGNHPYVGNALQGLADLARHRGAYDEAESLYTRSLSILEGTLGPDHLNLGSGLHNLAMLYSYWRRFAEAEPLYRRARVIWEKNLGPEDPYLANSLFGLASVQEDMGKYDDVEALYLRALATYQKAYGSHHRAVAQTLENLGYFYLLQIRIAEAERMWKRAVDIFEEVGGPESADVAYALNNLRNVYVIFGRDAEAARLLERSLSIWEKTLGPDHPGVALGLGNLSGDYKKQGRYEEAEELLKRAVAIDEKALGSGHKRVAMHLAGLGRLYRDLGRYAEAESLFVRALHIYENAYDPRHPVLGGYLFQLADFYVRLEAYCKAESLYERSLAIYENNYGPESTYSGMPVQGLVGLRRREGAYADAARLAERRWRILWRDLVENGSVVSERDALSYSRVFREAFDSYMTCIIDLQNAEAAIPSEFAGIVLSSKGQVGDVILGRQKGLVEQDSTTLALAEALRHTKFQVSNLVAQGSSGNVAEYRSRLDSLSGLANDLESDLAYRSARFRRAQELAEPTTDRIVSLLPENSAHLEYVRFNYHELEPDREIPHYALLFMSKDTEPRIIQLGEAKIIEALVDDYREHLAKVWEAGSMPTPLDGMEYAATGRNLYDLLLKPVEELLEGRTVVFLAPDGALNMISFASLIDEEGHYAVERWPVHYLSSSRDHIRFSFEGVSGTGLLALGAPDYDADAAARLSDEPVGSSEEQVYAFTRNIRSGCGELSAIRVDALPGSRREIQAVIASWTNHFDESVSAHLGADATEDIFKAKAPGRRVLHLATHGYYLEGRCWKERVGPGSQTYAGSYVENPMLLSGLLLAGANLHGRGADSLGLDDGILTAYEVSALDLDGVDLVVLSACETGLGKTEEGEGVYGLRRAFQVAGARTVVSALWPVSDTATADMMAALYERGEGRFFEVMHRVQLEGLRALRRAGEPDHPYSWAGFIATGDWR